MSGSTEWACLTAPELRATFAGPCVGLWAIGATEQHGPHLVTGFDHLAAHEVVQRAAAALGPAAVVLPTLAIGCSDHWRHFGATLSITQQTMISILEDVCRSAAAAGLAHLVIVNGHSGNVGAATCAVSALFDASCEVQFVSYWDLIGADAMGQLLEADNGVGHAGEFETSLALSLAGTVRRDQQPRSGDAHIRPVNRLGVYGGVRIDPATSNGVVGDPSRANSETGARLLELASAGLEKHCRSLMDI